jgi:hypothetical protein
MKLRTLYVACSIWCWVALLPGKPISPRVPIERITKEVRHELLMLPYLGVFDNLAYKSMATITSTPGHAPNIEV